MAVDLSSLSQQDRQDFESRLKVFGMDSSAVQEPLTVTGASVKLGYGPKTVSARQPFLVQTSDFAAVKRMVGIDDRVFKNVAPNVKLPNRIDLSTQAAGVLNDAQRRAFVAAPGHVV